MVTEYFFNFSYLLVWKNGKKNFPSRTIFFPTWKNIFPIFPGATLQKNNEISNQDNFLGLRKDRKQLEKVCYLIVWYVVTMINLFSVNVHSFKVGISTHSKPRTRHHTRCEVSQMFCFRTQCIQNKTFETPCIWPCTGL